MRSTMSALALKRCRRNYEGKPMLRVLVRGIRNVALIGLTLLLCRCGGVGGSTWGPMTESDENEVACRGYGFYPGSRQYDECLKYVEARRANRNTLLPSPRQ